MVVKLGVKEAEERRVSLTYSIKVLQPSDCLKSNFFFSFFFSSLLSFAIVARLTGPDGITSLPKTHQRESISCRNAAQMHPGRKQETSMFG